MLVTYCLSSTCQVEICLKLFQIAATGRRVIVKASQDAAGRAVVDNYCRGANHPPGLFS
jgi:hypothetical protein